MAANPDCMKCLGTGWVPISLDEPWLKGVCACGIEIEIKRCQQWAEEKKQASKRRDVT